MFFLGVHADGMSLKLAKIHKENKKIIIDFLRTAQITKEEGVVNPLYNLEAAFCKNQKIVTGLSPQEVFIRNLSLKLMDKRKILSTLPFQLDALLPYREDEAVTVPIIDKDEKSQASRVQVISTKKASIFDHIKKMQSYDFEPDILSTAPSALMRFFAHFCPLYHEAILFHIGATSSCAILISHNQLEHCYSFSFGTQILTEAIIKDFPQIEADEAIEKAKNFDLELIIPSEHPNLHHSLFHLQRELNRIIAYFQSKPCSKDVKHFAITGNLFGFSKLKDLISSTMPNTFEIISNFACDSYDMQTLSSYAIPLGLAIDALTLDGRSIQLRQKDFFSSKAKKKWLKTLSLCVAASLCLSMGIFSILHVYTMKKQDHCLELCQKYFPGSQSSTLEMTIQSIEKKKSHDPIPSTLSTSCYSVSEILAWLSAHPMLCRPVNSSNPSELIDIKNINYEMIKNPKVSSKNEPLLVKIELEFSSPSSRIARDFHDALIKGDSVVDEKKEITWNVKDSFFKTTFFIKPKKEVL
jgi:Tfp pilus assembly PilM family ATPase